MNYSDIYENDPDNECRERASILIKTLRETIQKDPTYEELKDFINETQGNPMSVQSQSFIIENILGESNNGNNNDSINNNNNSNNLDFNIEMEQYSKNGNENSEDEIIADEENEDSDKLKQKINKYKKKLIEII